MYLPHKILSAGLLDISSALFMLNKFGNIKYFSYLYKINRELFP